MARNLGRGGRGRGRAGAGGRGEGDLSPPREIPYVGSLLRALNPTHASNRAYDEVNIAILLFFSIV